MREALTAAVLVVLAGCAAPAASPIPDGAVEPEGPPAAAMYACLTGDRRAQADPCLSELRSSSGTLQEPFVAVDPRAPHRIAVGVNARLGPLELAPEAPLATARVGVHASSDGGASWTRSLLPHPPGAHPAASAGDPALAYAADGTLHATWMVGLDIYHASSRDAGTWSEPTRMSEAPADRNWIVASPEGDLWVSWQTPSTDSQVRWSGDAGATWIAIAGEALDGCIHASAISFSDAPLLACALFEGASNTRVRIVELDPRAASASLRGELDLPVWFPQLGTLPGGGLVVGGSVPESGTVLLARSDDAGRTWSEAVDARALSTADDAWDRARLYALGAGPDGVLHLLLRGMMVSDLPGIDLERVAGLAHVMLDPLDWNELGATRLVADLPTGDAAPRQDPVSPIGSSDDFGSLARDGDSWIAAWGHGGVVEMTRIVPGNPLPSSVTRGTRSA